MCFILSHNPWVYAFVCALVHTTVVSGTTSADSLSFLKAKDVRDILDMPWTDAIAFHTYITCIIKYEKVWYLDQIYSFPIKDVGT